MSFVDGLIIRDPNSTKALEPDARQRAGESLVEVLVAIHDVDPDAVGLGDLGRKEDYIARQLKRWYGQFQQSKMREVPVVDEMHDFLSAHIPKQQRSAIVHGDYRLDNCMLGPDGNVLAVLDWEICTLGDPLADLGLLMVYWNDPGETSSLAGGGATLSGGFPRRDDLRRMYAEHSTLDLGELDFYISFGYWKLACILDGVYTRYAKGAMGSDGASWQAFGDSVIHLAETSRAAAERIG
jgi:aminoglycoside phosphotransferase (APT) family kinase protein